MLTNSDIDHALGLILLRQRDTKLVVYANGETRQRLQWLDPLVDKFCGIDWRTAGTDFTPLGSGLAVRAIDLTNSVALQMRDESNGTVALIAPAVGEITDDLKAAAQSSQVVFFDGTFWSNDELAALRPGARNAREMNHLPIGDGGLDFLSRSPAQRKIYTHINNTNPILMPGSKERAKVEQAGIEIACDGLEVVL